jgi:hypothetical protein
MLHERVSSMGGVISSERRLASSRSIAARSKRRCPPSVRLVGTRPASPQRRTVAGATPSKWLASLSESQPGSWSMEWVSLIKSIQIYQNYHYQI